MIEATDLVERRKERRPRGFFGGVAEAVGGGSSGAEYAWPYITIRAVRACSD